MDKHTTTRRQLIRAAAYGGGAAIVAGGAALAGEARSATANRSAWEAGLAKIAATKASAEAYEPVYERAAAACEAAMPSADMIPYERFPYFERNALAHTTDLDQMERDIRQAAASLPGEHKARWLGQHTDAIEAIGKVREYRRQREAARRKADMDRVGDEYERRCEAHYAATWDLFNTPAPDLAALRWKAEHLFGEDQRDPDRDCPNWAARVIDVYMADVARLTPEAA